MAKTTFRLVWTGLMLGLVLLFQFLESYMPFGNFGGVKFNLSLAFILATLGVAGLPYALALLMLRFALGPLLSGQGYAPVSVVGQTALLVAGTLAVAGFYLLGKLPWLKRKALWQRHITSGFLLLALLPVFLAMLNSVFFTPWFISSFSGTFAPPLSIPATVRAYENLQPLYFYIPNYWGGQFAVYVTFNLINLSLNFVIFFLLSRVTNVIRPALISTY